MKKTLAFVLSLLFTLPTFNLSAHGAIENRGLIRNATVRLPRKARLRIPTFSFKTAKSRESARI
jgi:hypothetical protein